ncbi:hypothetical protein BKA70DRAFT_140367 [Coprinopsis sp. MPI-PUGE-AT-0042]|nr:hypothetical protein BKA70DRAFT_140367 [Coprinopsis sp. MPI-PUGE-AT-0042]
MVQLGVKAGLAESCVRTSGRLKSQRENGVGRDWSFLRGKPKMSNESFQLQEELKAEIKKEGGNVDDKAMVKKRVNKALKKGSPSTLSRVKEEKPSPVLVKQETKKEVKAASTPSGSVTVVKHLEEETEVEPLSAPVGALQGSARRKRKGNIVSSVTNSPQEIKVKREASLDVLPPPEVDHRIEPEVDEAVAVRQESPAPQLLTPEEKEAKEQLWRSKISKKVKCENLRFDLNVLWSRLVAAKIPPDVFPITLDRETRDVCVSRVFMSKTWGGSSQSTLPNISKKRFQHGLDDFMYPGPDCQPGTPEVPGAPGLWLDVEDREGTWWREYYGDKPMRVITRVADKPARWQYQGQYRVRLAETLTAEEWRQQKAKVRNAWAKQMSKEKQFQGLREYLIAKRFLGKEPEEHELKQLRAGKMETGMSEEAIQLCMTRGDLKMGVYTMECVGYDQDFQRQVAEKWGSWVPPPTTKKRKATTQLAAKNKKKRKTEGNRKGKGRVEQHAEEEEETSDDESETEDNEDGDVDDDESGAAYATYSSGTRSRPRLV